MSSESTEHISCGGCGTVNTVPYGLDKFRCGKCEATVSIRRAAKASRAAPRDAARSAGSQSSDAQARSSAMSSQANGGSFFGKLQNAMDKTMQKVEKNLMNIATSNNSGATGQTPQTRAAQPGTQAASVPLVKAQINPAAALTELTEEEQLRWALRASLETTSSATAAESQVPAGQPPSTATGAGSRLRPEENEALELLKKVESQAERLQKSAKIAQAREANANAERDMLQKQLEENEGLIRNLTEKLDAVNAQLEEQTHQCKVLGKSIDIAEGAATLATSDDGSATPELLERIEALEALLESSLAAESDADAPADKVHPAVSAPAETAQRGDS